MGIRRRCAKSPANEKEQKRGQENQLGTPGMARLLELQAGQM